MEYQEFRREITNSLSNNFIFDNPSGGTSEIKKVSVDKISYKRGNSIIYFSIQDMFSTFNKFSGTDITTSDLKRFKPEVYDSKARPAGLSCNCTFFFMVMNRAGLAEDIKGKGRRGNPFRTTLK